MIKIEEKPFGYKLTYSGIVSMAGIEKWLKDSEKILANSSDSFSVLVDMRNIEILPVECQSIMLEGQQLYKRMGMERSVVIVHNKLTAMQFKLIAQKTGIYEYERYINGADNEHWEKEALDWLLHEIEPIMEEEKV